MGLLNWVYKLRVDSGIEMIAGAFLRGPALQIPHLINKVASANVRNSHDAEASNPASGYTKVKSIVLPNGLVGAARFLFDLKVVIIAATPTAYGKIYRYNAALGTSAAIGTEQSNNTTSYVTKSEDLTQTWNPGDRVELYVKYGGAGSGTPWVQNFRLAYDDAPTVAVSSSNTTP